MFSSDKNVETIGQLVETLKHYIGLQKEYVKLDVIDKVVRLLTVATMVLVFCVILMMVLIYVSFAGFGTIVRHRCSLPCCCSILSCRFLFIHHIPQAVGRKTIG